MKALKQHKFVTDTWQLAPNLVDVDTTEQRADLQQGDVIVRLEHWQAERELLLARDARLGVLLSSEQAVEEIVADLSKFDLIALSLDKFSDGRAYSKAQQLRTRYGYTGELRAIGEVVYDQIAMLFRLGFDSLVLRDDQDSGLALHAHKEISVRYQPALDDAQLIFRQRESRIPNRH